MAAGSTRCATSFPSVAAGGICEARSPPPLSLCFGVRSGGGVSGGVGGGSGGGGVCASGGGGGGGKLVGAAVAFLF
jgi:hypothetical protein